MDHLKLLRGNQQIQHAVERGDAWPALVIGHVEEGFYRPIDSAGGVAVDLDHVAEEGVGEAAFPVGLYFLHQGFDAVEVVSEGELVDDGGVEGFIGVVVLAGGELGEERQREVGVFEVLEDSDYFRRAEPVFVAEEIGIVAVERGF